MTEPTTTTPASVPDLPMNSPFLLFTDDQVREIRKKRDTYSWARHAYYETLLSAERINKPVRSGDDDPWMVPPMAHTDIGRQRQHFYSSFCSTLVGYIDKDENYLRRAWETMEYALEEAAERWWYPCSLHIAAAIDGFTPVLSRDERERIEVLMRNALAKCRVQNGKHNVALTERKAMIAFGMLLNDKALVDKGLNTERLGVMALIRGYLPPDAYWAEASPGYHQYAVCQLVEIAWLCRRMGIDLNGLVNNRIQDACRAIFGLLDANLQYSGVGDTHPDGLLAETSQKMFEFAGNLFDDPLIGWALRQGSRQTYDSLAFGPANPHAEPPSAESRLYQDSGVAALRSGNMDGFWGSDGFTAFLRFGKHGGYHGHMDSLQLELRASGCEMITDRRRANQYKNWGQWLWHKTTLAHSTVVVDRKNQEEVTEPGECKSFISSPWASAISINSGAYPGVSYERTTVLTDRYCVDLFKAGSDQDHVFHYVLHGEGTYETSMPMEPLTSFGNGPGFDFLSNIRQTDIESRWEATLRQGSWNHHRWAPADTGMRVTGLSPVTGALAFASTWDRKSLGVEDSLILETSGCNTVFLVLMEPFRDAPSCRSFERTDSGDGIAVRTCFDECFDLLWYSPAASRVFEYGDVEFEGEFLACRVDARGTVTHATARNAKSFCVKGKQMLKDDRNSLDLVSGC